MATHAHITPAPGVSRVPAAPLIGIERRAIEDLIEALLLRLDAMDGDPDAEPDADSEPEPEAPAPKAVLVQFLVSAP